MMGAKDKTLVQLGISMIQSQERRNLISNLERQNLCTNSTRTLDDRLRGELRGGIDLEEMGLSLSKTAMLAKLKDAKKDVTMTTRLYNEKKKKNTRD